MREEIKSRGEHVRTTYRLRTWLVFGVRVFSREHVLAVFVGDIQAYPMAGGEAR